jgi:hypothetical protein
MNINPTTQNYFETLYTKIKDKPFDFAINVIKETGKGLLEGIKLGLAVSVIVLTVGSMVTFLTVASMTLAGIPASVGLILFIFKKALMISSIASILFGGGVYLSKQAV